MADYPSWLLRLVADVEHYEYRHSKVEEGDESCLYRALSGVPADARAQAQGYAQALREAAADPAPTDPEADHG